MNARLRTFILNKLPFMDGWCTKKKAESLCEIILKQKPALVVELGVFAGRSLFPMAMALEQNGTGRAVGIDPWSIDAAIEGENGKENDEWWCKNVDLERIFTNFVTDYNRLCISLFCSWVRDKAENCIDQFNDGTIDLLHQDSNHSELVSCRQVDQWQSKLSPRGIWVLDDTNWATQLRAIDKIKSYGFETIEDFGTYQIYQRKPQTDSALPT